MSGQTSDVLSVDSDGPQPCVSGTRVMKYCVGSEGRGGPGGMTPTGVHHAVNLGDAYESVAVCGQRTVTWPGKRFAPGPDDEECPVCRNVLDGLV